tara:strand:- start:1211 stop:1645 length:435 start_codon:yes stop_codon:yes gene_type:complete
MKNLEEIKKILPHRYPFLLIDRIIEIRNGEYCKTLKNISGNEEIFQGHFPNISIFPGVMIIEALAQTSGIVINSVQVGSVEENIVFFAGINNAKFRIPVIPGDQLILEAILKNQRKNFWVFEGKASVAEKLVAQAEIKLMLQKT